MAAAGVFATAAGGWPTLAHDVSAPADRPLRRVCGSGRRFQRNGNERVPAKPDKVVAEAIRLAGPGRFASGSKAEKAGAVLDILR